MRVVATRPERVYAGGRVASPRKASKHPPALAPAFPSIGEGEGGEGGGGSPAPVSRRDAPPAPPPAPPRGSPRQVRGLESSAYESLGESLDMDIVEPMNNNLEVTAVR